MSERMIIKEVFDGVWKEIELVYKSGLICSERHLQSEIFSLLKNNISFSSVYTVFIGPRVDQNTCENLHGKIPDLIIVNHRSKEIVAVVELEYVPFSYPAYKKDLSTLLNFFNNRKAITMPLFTNPNTGLWTNEKFKISESPILAYCVIAKADAHVITQYKSGNIKELWGEEGLANYLQYVGAVGDEISFSEELSITNPTPLLNFALPT
ncbi:hypothetical protein [Pedobacter sp. SL55]|uniref:hypothetical protein n=1 Tax=Pedobacter sp. SL55 TaxID=2995161 RepID=UPI00226D4DF2|nr:hypothetical protein [Pedobacter sp. SL55]WAC39108.1 hypothetical protein OVA16_10830 [Pedobacter sp. SL55]